VSADALRPSRPDGHFGAEADAAASRGIGAALGYAETVRQLERKLAHCHPGNAARVWEELAAARRGEGPTAFDWIVQFFADQQVPPHLA
jgi:hypothetical protein